MRKLIFISLVFIFSGMISSCQKEYFTTPVSDPNATVSFKLDLQPILTSKCAVSGCHNKSVPPNLLEDAAYSALTDGGFTDTSNPAQSILMIKLNTNMPPGKLPVGDINKFLFWMKQGAQEN